MQVNGTNESKLTVANLKARVRQDLVDTALTAALDELLESDQIGSVDEGQLRTEAINDLIGLGALQPFLDDPEIEEIWVNQPNEVFVARSGVSDRIEVKLSSSDIRNLVERMLRSTGRRLDRSTPFVDSALADGSRLHVVIPEITRQHWSLNIRKFPKQILRLTDLVAFDSMPLPMARFLAGLVRAQKNILISGGTQSGKTTMLCALLAEAAPEMRIVSVEETFELRTTHADWVALQTRQANLEGVGEVSLRRLVKESLRMRPSMIVVGEVREAESLDLLIAMNSGLPGLSTIHANSANEAISKLCTLPLLAGTNISSAFVNPTVANCIDVVVHCEIDASGKRSVAEIAEVAWVGDVNNGSIHVNQIFRNSKTGNIDELA